MLPGGVRQKRESFEHSFGVRSGFLFQRTIGNRILSGFIVFHCVLSGSQFTAQVVGYRYVSEDAEHDEELVAYLK